MPPVAPILERAGLLKTLAGGGLGFMGAQEENRTLLKDSGPNLKNINSLLGTLTGAATPAGAIENGGGLGGVAKFLSKAWVPKQMGMFGLNAAKKYIDIQQPIAETNLETARTQAGTAATEAAQANRLSARDMASIGLAGAGVAGAGGLGYYLYKTLGPGKKKSGPKVTVDMPMGPNGKRRPGDVKVEGDMDTLNLSKSLYDRLKRDERRQLLNSTRDSAQPDNVIPMPKQAYGIRTEVDDTIDTRMQNLIHLLRIL